ncbi:GNAT family N-acetyltransferase [Phenylobacterium sp.]|jgi:GNAT superfamily N-acetyltransferase|uniref:GNAT family N-acetyltransferase n=1 Tax=Phenylobacterium sp. TaxID=1871053 RepID=UPI002E324E11|nr:GNAT family N-acetyltransferase [Phenylobacterium sp.]HEX3364454.1 GNAT family N-acetyltransferase [Phenylobacterium sp.]
MNALQPPISSKVQVRVASSADAPLILEFIKALAEYERLGHDVEATEADIRRDLFGENPRCFCDIAEAGGQPVGFALWFYNYSTFRGRAGIYLEDLFVKPEARGLGAGKALLRRLAQRCMDADLGRLEWSVLNWNTPAIEFYDSLDAASMEEWTVRRLYGEALQKLAES